MNSTSSRHFFFLALPFSYQIIWTTSFVIHLLLGKQKDNRRTVRCMTCGFWMPVLIFGEIPVRMWHLSSVAVIHPPCPLGGNASSLHHGARPFHIMVYPGASMPLSKIQKLNSCLGWQKEEADGMLKNYIRVFHIQRKSHYRWSPSLSRKRKLDSVSLF